MNIILIFFLSFFTAYPEPTETVDLQIIVTNISTIKGAIEVGVFNDAKTFLEEGKAYKTISKKVTQNSLVITLKGMPKGSYGISLYHDVNSDSKCNLNFVGIPLEPYGFSKNYKPTISKPTFEQCKIVAQKNTSITIELID